MTWRQRARDALGTALVIPTCVCILCAAIAFALVTWVDDEMEHRQ